MEVTLTAAFVPFYFSEFSAQRSGSWQNTGYPSCKTFFFSFQSELGQVLATFASTQINTKSLSLENARKKQFSFSNLSLEFSGMNKYNEFFSLQMEVQADSKLNNDQTADHSQLKEQLSFVTYLNTLQKGYSW